MSLYHHNLTGVSQCMRITSINWKEWPHFVKNNRENNGDEMIYMSLVVCNNEGFLLLKILTKLYVASTQECANGSRNFNMVSELMTTPKTMHQRSINRGG